MSKRGVSKISGNSSPKVGEATTYTITDWCPATPQTKRNAAGVTWELFKKRTNGSFTTTNIKKIGSGTFTFGEVAQRNTYRLEAYLYEPEGSGPACIDINPQPVAIPRINKVELQYVDDSPGTVFSYTEKMRARAQCVNLAGQKLKFSLWEDDAAGDGHNANNLLIETKEATVDSSGIAVAEFMLTRALMQKALQGETDPKQLEFYVTVEYFSNRKHATDNVNVNNPLPVPTTRPQPRPQQSSNNSQPSQPSPNNVPPRAQGSPAAEKPQSQKEEKGIVDTVTDWWNNLELWDWGESSGTIEPTQPPTQQPVGGRTVSIVQDSAVEDLLDAYFAKKEYTRQTGEAAGTFEYKIGSNGNKTSIDAEKENIAKIILAKPAVKALAAKKEYTTLEAIKQAFTKEVYNKDEKVTFQTFKLGAEFKKINNAPLEAKVYLVARTSGLNGKQATIIIKEKDGLIKGSTGAVLPVLEITDEQMEQASVSGDEVQGTEKTEFTATIENGIAKVPVYLRPKSDDELKQWKEKVSKGKEEGEYTYKFGGTNNITDENSKKRIAETILKNSKSGNSNNEKNEEGKSAYLDDIIKVLEIKTYLKDQTIKFKLYKKEKELLYLQAKAQGEKQHDKEFLKEDGAYFEITKGNCSCNRDLTDIEFQEILKSLREPERLEINGIWQPRNAGGSNPEDASLASTVRKFNEVMKKYDINTCIRKVYFIAECYHETDRFYSTKEYDSSHTPNYDPYRGRGIIQLTHKEAYERYAFYKEDDTIVTDYNKIATDIDLVFDSAGWYWRQGKLLSVGDRWTPTSGAQQTFKLNSRSYPKTNYDTEYTHESGSIVRRYGSVNLNLVADNDDINTISYLINGGDNGLEERKKYLKELKEIQFFICEDNKSGDWHDPVDNPISTNLYQNGNLDNTSKIWGLFGDDIRQEVNRKHTGLDLFATTGTTIFACVDGTVYNRRWHSGYGNTITIKVKDPKVFMARKRNNYTHKTTREMESGTNWDDSGDIYLFYAHLDSVKAFTFEQEVKCGDPLGTTGRSGVTGGTHAPHLHFEIFCSYNMGVGTNYRINPAYFVEYKYYDDQSESERNTQITEKDRGQITEVNGTEQLGTNNLF